MTEKEYDNLPEKVKAIVDSYDDNEDLYEECYRIQVELGEIGWTCDYDLSGEVFDVRKKTKMKATIEYENQYGKTKTISKSDWNGREHIDNYIGVLMRKGNLNIELYIHEEKNEDAEYDARMSRGE